MKRIGKSREGSKRDLFSDLMDGVRAMDEARDGKLTLRTFAVELEPLPRLSPKLIRETRERFKMSRPLFARHLRTNPRTLELWEQGRSKPNDQAAALIWMVRKYPDTLERLMHLAKN